MKPKRKPTFIKQVPTLSGRKKYEFVALKRREAMETAHNSLLTVLGAVGEVTGYIFRDTSDDSENVRNEITSGIVRSLSKIEFSTVWKLAESILRGVTIEDDELIEDINETDYFADNLDEFYSALVAGIEGNYPAVFLKVREGLKGFDLPGIVQNMSKPDETSNE